MAVPARPVFAGELRFARVRDMLLVQRPVAAPAIADRREPRGGQRAGAATGLRVRRTGPGKPGALHVEAVAVAAARPSRTLPSANSDR